MRTPTRYYLGALLALISLVLLFGIVRCDTSERASSTLEARTTSYNGWRRPATTSTSTTEAPVTTTEAPPASTAFVSERHSKGSAVKSEASGSSSGGWEAVRQCESGGNYGYDDGTYGGAYNFDRGTFASVGGRGNPADASPAEQDAAAQRLYNERGSAPWPQCGRYLR